MSAMGWLLLGYAITGSVCVLAVLIDAPWRRGRWAAGYSLQALLALLALAWLLWPLFAWENRPGRRDPDGAGGS